MRVSRIDGRIHILQTFLVYFFQISFFKGGTAGKKVPPYFVCVCVCVCVYIYIERERERERRERERERERECVVYWYSIQ